MRAGRIFRGAGSTRTGLVVPVLLYVIHVHLYGRDMTRKRGRGGQELWKGFERRREMIESLAGVGPRRALAGGRSTLGGPAATRAGGRGRERRRFRERQCAAR